MQIFTKTYDWVMRLSVHKHAKKWLAVISFAESSFFLVPPDLLLMPMSVRQPQSWFMLALITTVTSVLGGLFGYMLGWFLIDEILPYISKFGYEPAYVKARAWYDAYGIWVVLLTGFTPIPYKIFTVTSGALGLFLPGFIIMSLIGRGSRFFLVAFLCARFGQPIEKHLYTYIDRIGWVIVAIVVAAYGISKVFL